MTKIRKTLACEHLRIGETRKSVGILLASSRLRFTVQISEPARRLEKPCKKVPAENHKTITSYNMDIAGAKKLFSFFQGFVKEIKMLSVCDHRVAEKLVNHVICQKHGNEEFFVKVHLTPKYFFLFGPF